MYFADIGATLPGRTRYTSPAPILQHTTSTALSSRHLKNSVQLATDTMNGTDEKKCSEVVAKLALAALVSRGRMLKSTGIMLKICF